jgi:hypothetical protein
MAVLVLAMLAGAGLWLTLSRAQRAELELVLLRANPIPLAVSAASIVGVAVLAALLLRRKSRFLTSAVEAAHSEFAPALSPRQRAMVALPHVGLSLLGLSVYAYLYAAGVTRWFFLGMLGQPKLAALRGGLVLLNTCGPALLIPAFAVVLLNGTGITRRLKAGFQAPEDGLVAGRRLPDPGDYQR